MATCEELKSKGNEHFVKSEFAQAEALYTEALEKYDESRVILFTNRAAARIGLEKFLEGLQDCEEAIAQDPTWAKAYFRKSTCLEKLGRLKDSFLAWHAAARHCERNAWLVKQLKQATLSWIKVFRTEPVENEDDFILTRFSLLPDSRHRLSTMAHFWNESTNEERFHHFLFLLTVIGGEGELSEKNRSLTAEMMMPMPLHNYPDLPKENIQSWCDFFASLSVEGKTSIFKRIWDKLDAGERDAVVFDLKVFIARAIEIRALMAQSSSSAGGYDAAGDEGGDDEGSSAEASRALGSSSGGAAAGDDASSSVAGGVSSLAIADSSTGVDND